MDNLKDILLEDEQVIWSGRPDPELVSPLAPYWKRKLKHLLWLLFTALVVVALIWWGRTAPAFSFLFFVLAAIGIIGIIPATITLFDFNDQAEDPSKHRYLLTNSRLIVRTAEVGVEKEIFPNAIVAIELYKKQSPSRLNIFYGQSENEFVSLVGLSNADDVKTLVTKTLAPRNKKS